MLENRIDKRILRERLMNETFKRKTLSFYKYFNIEDAQEFRNDFYRNLDGLNCFGRIYLAHEGINAQMNVPEYNVDKLMKYLYSIPELNNVPIKWAIEDDGKSFYKLTIKVRQKIVADGLENNSYDLSKVGKHLSALEFHEAIDKPGTIVVDMRNHYESEIGHFINAYCPDVDTFREEIQLVLDKYKDDKDKEFLI